MTFLKKRKAIASFGEDDLNKSVNILFCSDINVICGLGVSIISILENIAMPCTIHVAYRGILPINEERRLNDIAVKYGAALYVYWINDTAIQELTSNSYITITAYYRLIMPYILEKMHINKCLYLDTDTLCIRDISTWYTQNLYNKIAFVTKDATSRPFLREHVTCQKLGMKSKQYFNSGILLININEYVRQDIGNKDIELCKEKHFGEMDQGVLNILLEGKVICDNSYAYNCGMSVRNNEVPEKIYLIHFTGAKKPWKLCTSKLKSSQMSLFDKHSWEYQYYAIWRKYASISPWKNEPFDLPKNYREWRYSATMYLKSGKVKSFLKAYYKYLVTKHAH